MDDTKDPKIVLLTSGKFDMDFTSFRKNGNYREHVLAKFQSHLQVLQSACTFEVHKRHIIIFIFSVLRV